MNFIFSTILLLLTGSVFAQNVSVNVIKVTEKNIYAAGKGIWKSEDNGSSFTEINTHPESQLPHGSKIDDLTVHNNVDIITGKWVDYVAVISGGRLYKSKDGGNRFWAYCRDQAYETCRDKFIALGPTGRSGHVVVTNSALFRAGSDFDLILGKKETLGGATLTYTGGTYYGKDYNTLFVPTKHGLLKVESGTSSSEVIQVGPHTGREQINQISGRYSEVFVGSGHGLYLSKNSGKEFNRVILPNPWGHDYWDVWDVDAPKGNQLVLVATNFGSWFSKDGGQSFRRLWPTTNWALTSAIRISPDYRNAIIGTAQGLKVVPIPYLD